MKKGWREIELTRGYKAIVDVEDFEHLSRFNWYVQISRTIYAARSAKKHEDKIPKNVYMHRQITKARKGEVVDHEDGNGLNNTRANLRVGTHSDNQQNRRKHRENPQSLGTRKTLNGYAAQIKMGKKKKDLGTFATQKEAHEAFLKAAKERSQERLCPPQPNNQ